MHDKAALIAPSFMAHLGVTVQEVYLDTDALGTFAGEVPRPGSPLETVSAKARLSMAATGSNLALASEGTIGPHPDAPFVTCDIEIVMLVDDMYGYAVHEIETSVGVPAIAVDVDIDSIDRPRLEAAGFPAHGVIVRPSDGFDPIVKGLHDLEAVYDAVRLCAAMSSAGTARIESDFRAHHHPSRRLVIRQAAERLAQRLAVQCSECGTPGWGVVGRERGAPCSVCATETDLTLADIYGCVRCELKQSVHVAPVGGVDPARCPWCNP